MCENFQKFNLINVANIKSGLLVENFVNSEESFFLFENVTRGIPILVAADENLFEFKSSDVFELEPSDVLKVVYGNVPETYIGFKHSFKSFRFLSRFEVKAKHVPFVQNIRQRNELTKNFIAEIKSKYSVVGAFQTRNVPHEGHELIMKKMLDLCEFLVVNPVVGPKKRGDINTEHLKDIYEGFIRKKFGNKVAFMPVHTNMYYAGPREAIHHARIRSYLGFDLFSVGRDHAGAEGAYNDTDAAELVNEKHDMLGLRVLCHSGAAFCSKCQNVKLVGDCSHPLSDFRDISGTSFRQALQAGKFFEFADYNLQKLIHKNIENLFEND